MGENLEKTQAGRAMYCTYCSNKKIQKHTYSLLCKRTYTGTVVNALINGIVIPVRTDAIERRFQRTYANLLPGAHTA